MLIGGAKDEHFSYFHSSCQLGLKKRVTTCRLTSYSIVNVILLFQFPPYFHGAGMCFGCKFLTFSSSPFINLRIFRWWMWRWRYSQKTITHTCTMGDRKCYQWDKIILHQLLESNKIRWHSLKTLIWNVLKKSVYWTF